MAEQDITEERISFYSAGQPMVGNMFVPAGDRPAEGFPAILCLHGYGGLRKTTLPETARAYARAGFVVLIFDYRGFGESGGERGVLNPRHQVVDARNALTVLAEDDRVDSRRIGVHGSSFGGAVAASAAAADMRIRCVVCSVAIGNGRRWLKSLRRNWEWVEFERELATDRIERARSGKSRWVDPYYVMISDPISEKRHVELNAKMPERAFQMPLECAEAIIEFAPEEEIAHAPPRPGLIISVEDDYLVQDEESRQLHAHWPGDKRFVIIPNVRHHDLFTTALPLVMAETLPWFRKYLDIDVA